MIIQWSDFPICDVGRGINDLCDVRLKNIWIKSIGTSETIMKIIKTTKPDTYREKITVQAI